MQPEVLLNFTYNQDVWYEKKNISQSNITVKETSYTFFVCVGTIMYIHSTTVLQFSAVIDLR